jgi:mannose-6-phosphate isomerase
MTSPYPLLLQSTLHEKPWGGTALADQLGKLTPAGKRIGEAWELHDSSVIRNGDMVGKTLGDALAAWGTALVGKQYDLSEGFPLLAKFIDANEWLSIQDHPNDEQARELEGEPRGKNEAWYVLAAQPSAKLLIGIQPGTSRETVAEAIRSSTLEQYAVYAEVAPGDVLYVEANTIHALGPGVLIYEIQQSSNTTYRLYDWGRTDRELHIEKGLRVANLTSLPTIRHTGRATEREVAIAETPHFATRLYQLNTANGRSVRLDTQGTHFHSLTCIGGSALVRAGIHVIALHLGDTALIPAAWGAYSLATNDSAHVILSQPA